ncbi:PREDICTED: uncharacterized protein LOC106811007 [Priapulus caudatus]|uniref:Uncharacterized protein LOC106811007 n=1 Tax=Priapulus caudatus TaxID=37621 RepID=A0ABM1ECT1_PRICU|nr:PREDICTED: uncharacterized protein LOC106811007 [Priapulus caudatus]
MHLILLATLVLAVTAVPLTDRVRFQQHQKVFDYQVPFYNEGLQEGRDSLKDNIIQGIFGGNQQGSLEEGGYSQDNFHFQKKEFERYLNGRDFERLRDSHVLGRFFSSDSLQKYYPSENFVQFFRDPNFVRSYDFQSEYFVDYVTSPELRKYVELPEFQEFLQHPLFRHYYTSDYFWQHVGNSHFNEHYQDHELRQYFQDFFNQVLPVLNLQGGDFVQRDSVSEHHEQYLRYFILYVLHDPYFYYHVHHYGRQHPVYQQYFENVDHLDEVFQWFHDHVGTPSVGYSEVQERNQLVDQQRGYEYNTDTYGDDSTQGKGDYFQNSYGQDTINTQEESGRLYISPVVRRYLQTHPYLRSYILKGYLPSHIRSQIFSDLQGKVRPYLLQVFRNSYLPQHVREVILRTVYNQRQGGEQYQHDSNTPDYGYNTDTYGDGYTQGRDDYFKNTYDQDTISTQEESGRLYISPVVRRYLQTHSYLKSYILKGYLPSHIRSQIFSDLQGKVKPYLLQGIMHLILLATLVVAVTAVPLTDRVRWRQHHNVYDYDMPILDPEPQYTIDDDTTDLMSKTQDMNRFHYDDTEFKKFLQSKEFTNLIQSDVLKRFFTWNPIMEYLTSTELVQFLQHPDFVRDYQFQSNYFVDYITSPELRRC